MPDLRKVEATSQAWIWSWTDEEHDDAGQGGGVACEALGVRHGESGSDRDVARGR